MALFRDEDRHGIKPEVCRKTEDRHVPKFVLNISPIEFEDAEVEVGVFTYESRSSSSNYVPTHGSTHVFRRERGTEVVAVPFVDDAPILGDTSRNGAAQGPPRLGGSPLSQCPHRPSPPPPPQSRSTTCRSAFLADELKDNLLHQAVPAGLRMPGLAVRLPSV